ncbi:N-acetylmuramoyl-L-alanine amidase [Paenibacillus melissococcoides]|uniref:N-acetylmuramoyl-L-alanine amidase n=2 Tax=Paenibacillus TaxID=44249 RepID=A0ABM9FVL1_9BACL|nr:N-acetylmuramoyl-L-alanine amidase [Paenibacillus melissococcoides]CAH8242825.1 N-acetylmuramoyl-L-alanine amidase [Paenibacillus melissococcoides]CAH8248855.1 N-acetylmuramoyl-L-alanine amidase [Paenibacillus melissococcoides]CAH8703215.1 N-acetylmuramoyl-L-alanine amidase [Paenibacillus melissococcoides]CAH8705978.1 N-acetylmuramoyl-L-alanine amidase [Paenibacillus melissococcoides]CAH8720603.1 N-acetylmuramoyl-L-alanine amidase [Paenibacillus melissococcoides]
MVAAIEEVKKVLWDGGHGGKDPGSSGNGVVEKNIALQVATEAAKRLEQEYEGVQCLLSRSTDSYLSLKERTDKANAAGAHLLVSIHCNAGGGKGGFESFTYSGTKDAATAAFQDVLHSEIMKKLKPFGVIDRGQKKKDLHVCRESRMPAVLTENLFVDVAADAARLKRPEVIEAIVAGHVAGVAKYLKLQPKKAQQPPASGATNILGPASATVEQAREWARSKNAPAEFVDLAELYWELAPKHGGVDPAVAYVQFGHETGYLYRDGRSAAGIDASYKNPCGLKVTAGGGDYQASAHKRFTDWREGITAHLDHLALYAGAAGYPRAGTPDPRHFAYLLGTAKTVESLGGKWAPSTSYGQKLVQYLKEVQAMEKPKQPDYVGHWAEASIRRVMEAGIMNGRNTGFAPNEPITRAEIAVVVDRMLKQMGK